MQNLIYKLKNELKRKNASPKKRSRKRV